MPSRSLHSSFGKVTIYGAPLLLAIVELFHPQPRDLLKLDVHMWLAVHYAQIALFPLSALAMAWLIRGRTGIAAAISRVALFVFGIGWTAWDSVAGVATGILIDAAHKPETPGAWRAPIDAIWLHPIMGGGPAPFFAALGAVALSVGAVAAAKSLSVTGQSWGPVVLLGLSSFGITIFKTHAWPGGAFDIWWYCNGQRMVSLGAKVNVRNGASPTNPSCRYPTLTSGTAAGVLFRR
jgi:hypothetical protein